MSILLVWVIGVVFILSGLATLFSKPFAGIVTLLAGVAFLPPTWKFLNEKYKFNPSLPIKAVIVIALLGLNAIFGDHSSTNSTTTDQQTNTTAAAVVSDTPSDTPEPTVTLAPTLSPDQIIAKFEKEGQDVTVADIYKSPNSYKGKSVIFSCSVSGFPKDSNGDVGGLNCNDLNDYVSNVQVGISKNTDVTKINQNDTIKVYGMVLGADTGKNGFGADITTGAVMGLYINDLTTGYKNY